VNALQQALHTTRVNGQWESLSEAPLPVRQHVDASIGAVLETLDAVPDLLEVPPAH
jgi:high-affinity iron transporter